MINILDCNEYDLRLKDGTLYKIICTSEDIDKLINFIGEENIADIEEN